MYWLEDHLEEGSFKSCYADTDSMALALTRSGPEMQDQEASLRSLFDPLVKPSKKVSWEASWKSWFVTTDEIWDIRKPGKLKGESGHFGHCPNILDILTSWSIWTVWTLSEHFEKCSIFQLLVISDTVRTLKFIFSRVPISPRTLLCIVAEDVSCNQC